MQLAPSKLLLAFTLGAVLTFGQSIETTGPAQRKNPIAEIRALLALPPAQRSDALGQKTEQQKKLILSKLDQYDKLDAAEREARLKMLEVHWYLKPLMELPPTQRGSGLAALPSQYKQVIQERLREWDQIPASNQKELLHNEQTFAYFARAPKFAKKPSSPAMAPSAQTAIVPPEIPVDNSEVLVRQAQHFLAMPPKQREKALEALTPAERSEVSAWADLVEKIPAPDRKAYLSSFARFAAMPAVRREQFFRNIQRWQAMSVSDRASWKEIIQNLPPLPEENAPPFPPIQSAPPLPAPQK